MAESGLSVGLPELRTEVGFYLGHGRGVSPVWPATEISVIDGIVQSGVRRVYYPPANNAGVAGYEWSWLRPTETLAIIAADGDYDLPDDFGRLIGRIHYPAAEYRGSLSIVSVSKLLQRRAGSNLTGAPTCAAIRYKASDGSTGQRQEILFFPTPDDAWTLSYEYEAYSGPLTVTYPYPLGGMQLAELYIESCLAIAESRINDEIGLHTQAFNALLVDAIARDRKRGARTFGQMGHIEKTGDLFTRDTGVITYKGETI